MRHSKIFTTDEVCSIMQGKMTAFYEVVKPQPIPPRAIYNLDEVEAIISLTPNIMGGKTGVMFNWKSKRHPHIADGGFWTHTFHYSIGQKIYVRESWHLTDNTDAGGKGVYWEYKADTDDVAPGGWDNVGADERPEYARWKSPATMPREAARTWLAIVGVKCMDTQDLSNKLCHTLGITPPDKAAFDENKFIFLYEFKLSEK